MATRRMFSRTIVCNDNFASMPHSAQALYFQLVMHADDDGFVDSANSLRIQFRCKKSDLQLLMDRNYLIRVTDHLYLIRQWYTQNQIRKDRYQSSRYLEQAITQLFVDSDGCYQFLSEAAAPENETSISPIPATDWQPLGNPV